MTKQVGYLESHTGQEPGDPRKGAATIIQLADQASPPLRLVLGNDALALGRQSYQQNLEELERWASVSQSTDFDSLSPRLRSISYRSFWQMPERNRDGKISA